MSLSLKTSVRHNRFRYKLPDNCYWSGYLEPFPGKPCSSGWMLFRTKDPLLQVRQRSDTCYSYSVLPYQSWEEGLHPETCDFRRRQAPFLLSLSLLIYCRATLQLDPQACLSTHIKRFNHHDFLHIGSTGALRVPLDRFNARMM